MPSVNLQTVKQELLIDSGVLIVIPIPHDIDAIVSASLLRHFLAEKATESRVISQKPLTNYFKAIAQDFVVEDRWPKTASDRVVILVDTPDLRHSGFFVNISNLQFKKLILIDHHPVSDLNKIADVSWTNPSWSSTAEAIYHLISSERKVNHHEATSILLAILADTKNFQNRTSSQTFLLAAKLLSLGADRFWLEQFFNHSKHPANQLKLWGQAFKNATVIPEWHLLIANLDYQTFQELELDIESTNGLANFLAEQHLAPVVILTVEQPDRSIRGLIRSTDRRFHAGQIARLFGGRGFDRAGGFEIPPDFARLI